MITNRYKTDFEELNSEGKKHKNEMSVLCKNLEQVHSAMRNIQADDMDEFNDKLSKLQKDELDIRQIYESEKSELESVCESMKTIHHKVYGEGGKNKSIASSMMKEGKHKVVNNTSITHARVGDKLKNEASMMLQKINILGKCKNLPSTPSVSFRPPVQQKSGFSYTDLLLKGVSLVAGIATTAVSVATTVIGVGLSIGSAVVGTALNLTRAGASIVGGAAAKGIGWIGNKIGSSRIGESVPKLGFGKSLTLAEKNRLELPRTERQTSLNSFFGVSEKQDSPITTSTLSKNVINSQIDRDKQTTLFDVFSQDKSKIMDSHMNDQRVSISNKIANNVNPNLEKSKLNVFNKENPLFKNMKHKTHKNGFRFENRVEKSKERVMIDKYGNRLAIYNGSETGDKGFIDRHDFSKIYEKKGKNDVKHLVYNKTNTAAETGALDVKLQPSGVKHKVNNPIHRNELSHIKNGFKWAMSDNQKGTESSSVKTIDSYKKPTKMKLEEIVKNDVSKETIPIKTVSKKIKKLIPNEPKVIKPKKPKGGLEGMLDEEELIRRTTKPEYNINNRIYDIVYTPKNNAYKNSAIDSEKLFQDSMNDLSYKLDTSKLSYENVLDIKNKFNYNFDLNSNNYGEKKYTQKQKRHYDYLYSKVADEIDRRVNNGYQ